MVFLVAICLGSRVGEIGSLLSVSPYIKFFPDKIVLQPSSDFLRKVALNLHRSADMVHPVCPPSPSTREEVCIHTLNLPGAFSIYPFGSEFFRVSDSLFVTFGFV